MHKREEGKGDSGVLLVRVRSDFKLELARIIAAASPQRDFPLTFSLARHPLLISTE